jgi:hypothetical protein
MSNRAVWVVITMSVASMAIAQTKPAPSTPKPRPKTSTTAPAPAAAPAKATPAQKPVVAPPSREAKPAADDINTWAKPLYRTAKGQEKTIIQVDKFPYRESVYLSQKPVEPLPKDKYSFVTPEEALISRLSAMTNLDYDGWLKTWDEKSQKFLKDLDARPDFGPQKRINQWRGVFGQVKPVLVRRIETGSYVIVTYKLLNKAGQDAGLLEYPTPFKQVGGLWIGTQELQSDALMNMSPWVSGKMAGEGDARPMTETVIK